MAGKDNSSRGMRPLKALISFQEAVDVIERATVPLDRTEEIKIEDALGRVLAEDILSETDVPPFARAAEDGYAVIVEDTYGASIYQPKELKLIGVVHAGQAPEVKVERGTCVQVATGAVIPDGTTAVVRVEDTVRDGDIIRVQKPVYPGHDISPAGEDIKKGDLVLRAGDILNPARIGVLSAIGLSTVKVYSRPRVAILPTGDEIVRPGKPLSIGQIYDVNSFTLSAAVENAGGVPFILGSVGDTVEAVKKALDALTKEYDVIVFSGGSSVGERDLLIDVVSEVAEVHFHGVAVKPGKPTWFATTGDGKLIFGMPGYPTSCLSDAYVFLQPAIRVMGHMPPQGSRKVKALMGERVNSTLGRVQFFTVKLEGEYAMPAFKTSGAITSMAHADGYILIPANVDLIDRGDEVEVFLFEV